MTDTFPELPYNSVNKVINKNDIISIFQQYGLHTEPKNIDFYRTAMVHRSYCTRKNENFTEGNIQCPLNCLPLQEESYERYEFLGDSILGVIVATYFFNRFIDRENEGFLTKMRTKIVNGIMVAHLCSLTPLPSFVIISKQIEANNGRDNTKIKEDLFEAFLGAMYKDFYEQQQEDSSINALSLCETWLINLLEENIDFTQLILANTNFKDQFQKYFVTLHNYFPLFYELNNETTANGKIYNVCIKNDMQGIIAVGSGSSKKLAENDAAHNALNNVGAI
jgi:ribonuclease-3